MLPEEGRGEKEQGKDIIPPSSGEVQVITNQRGLNAKGLKNILSPVRNLGYSHQPKE